MKTLSISCSLILFLSVSCNEKGTNPDQDLTRVSFFSGKCGQEFLKASDVQDSSFVYTFFDDLIIDFSVGGNCCPDSNRFYVNHNISNDTIYISVDDTAGHRCWCICNYHMYAQFKDLHGDHYVVICTLEGAYNNPLYAADCYRMQGLISEKSLLSARRNYE